MSSITLKNISKWFSDNQVIKNIDLNIKNGEFVVFVGPSGCGKSTLLRIISGLEDLDNGSISIDDVDVTDKIPYDRGISMVFQSYALYPHMSVFDNIGFSLKTSGVKNKIIEKRVHEIAKILRLDNLLHRLPKQLSGGQRQRVAIGRAIIRKPKAFLFDEPLSNLDAKLRTQMRTEIKKLHQKLKTTIIYVTHDQVEAMTLADRIIIMKDGYIEQIGSPIEVFSKPANVFVATFIGSPPMNIFSAEIINSNNNIKIKLDDNLYFDCTEDQKNKLQNKKNIFLGIRAEDIMPIDNNTNTSFWSFKRNVDIVEPLGTETQLFITINNKEIISRMYNPYEVNVGDELTFQVDPSKVHFFDRETEKAII